MLHIDKLNYNKKRKESVAPLVAGMAGVLAGAASVSLILLSDKEIREKVLKRGHQLKAMLQEWSIEKLESLDLEEGVYEESNEGMPLQIDIDDFPRDKKSN